MIAWLRRREDVSAWPTGHRIQILTICLVVVILCTGCQKGVVHQPTQDQLLGRIMSADNYSVEFFRGGSTKLQADIGILTASTGYLTPLMRSQLAGSIAGRFETMANIGIAVMPLNEKDPGFDSVDSKEIQAARLMTDVPGLFRGAPRTDRQRSGHCRTRLPEGDVDTTGFHLSAKPRPQSEEGSRPHWTICHRDGFLCSHGNSRAGSRGLHPTEGPVEGGDRD
jgi:hypothetical protein